MTTCPPRSWSNSPHTVTDHYPKAQLRCTRCRRVRIRGSKVRFRIVSVRPDCEHPSLTTGEVRNAPD